MRYSYLNEDYNVFRISKIVDNNIIDDIVDSQGKLKDYKYIDDGSAPPILLVRGHDYHIPIYDDPLTNNVIPEDDKNINIKYSQDNITYNGKKYTLDSAIITNTNIENKEGHIISGITCKKERYVYNGWPRLNTEPAKATRELEQDIPCKLMKWNWNTVYDTDICLNRLKCTPEILKKKVGKGDFCFNFSGGIRILVYVRDDAKSATSSSHSKDRSPARSPAKSPARSPARSPTTPIRKKQPSKKPAATAKTAATAQATVAATVAATTREAQATARAARAAARAARAAAT